MCSPRPCLPRGTRRRLGLTRSSRPSGSRAELRTTEAEDDPCQGVVLEEHRSDKDRISRREESAHRSSSSRPTEAESVPRSVLHDDDLPQSPGSNSDTPHCIKHTVNMRFGQRAVCLRERVGESDGPTDGRGRTLPRSIPPSQQTN